MNPAAQSDHDLLVELRTEVKAIREEIKDIKEGGKETILDHEVRIRRLEFWGALGIGGAYVVNAILGLYAILHH